MYNNYLNNGVILTPNVVAKGDNASVIYRGILFNSGADSIYARVGYGDRWDNARDIQMKRTCDGFEAVLPVTTDAKLSLAFKDSANNWDNNSSRNYSFDVQSR